MDGSASLVGQLLLAMPGIGDPRFDKAVIAMCAHDDHGALGIGIGRTVPRLGLHALYGQLELDPGILPDLPVHIGGPVEPQRGFLIHSNDWQGEDTLDVAGRWSLTGTLDILRAIAAGQGPSRWILALGYAGWSEGQLEAEMTGHGWFTTPAEEHVIFSTPTSERWRAAFSSAGIDTRWLANVSGQA